MRKQMYSKILGATLIVLLAAHAYAQAPQKFSYQAVIRNASNAIVVNQAVGVRVSIIQNLPNGFVQYSETHVQNTNDNGLVTLQIGGGTVVSGAMVDISWSDGPYYLKTEIDPTGGTNYTIIGTTELLSVPFALFAGQVSNIYGTPNRLARFWNNQALGNSSFSENEEGRVALNYEPISLFRLFVYENQVASLGNGQHVSYAYRTRDVGFDGVAYSVGGSNSASAGYNFYGDQYSFGTAGFCYNDFSRTGGLLGAHYLGNYWGSMGYKNSASNVFGVYGSAAYSSGIGFLPNVEHVGIGGAFFGGVVGSANHGLVIGQLNSGNLFASYNMGNTYTYGKNIELVGAQNQTKTALYSVSSVDATIYSKGTAQLVNGQAFIEFDDTYSLLLGENPVVTVSPNGNCNGVYVAEITKEGFTVRELNNGNSNAPISWIAVGNRIDNRMDEATRIVSAPDFNRNIQQVLFDDGNTDGKAMGIWWDGQQLQFGELPEHLTRVEKSNVEK